MDWQLVLALVAGAVAVTTIFWRSIRQAGKFVSAELYDANRKNDDLRYAAIHSQYVEIRDCLDALRKDVASIIERNKLLDKGWKAPEE